MNRFLNSVRRRSASPGKSATPSPKGTTTTQSPVTATTPGSPSPAARTPGSTSSRRKKLPPIPTHGKDGKKLTKSQIRQRKIKRREKQIMDSEGYVERDPYYWKKQDENKWERDAKPAAEQFMNRYASMGPEAIRAEFLKEVGDYRNPNTAHTWFDAYPDKNRDKDQITCLDENRVMLPSDNTKYINASWAEIKKPSFQSATLLNSLCRKYILTQIPLQSTMEEYWQMIFENRVTAVLLLIPKIEDPKKFDKFWPTNLDEEKVYGGMTITCVEKSTILGSNVAILEVLQKGKEPRIARFCVSGPSLNRPYADTAASIHSLCRLTGIIDQIEDESDCHPSRDTVLIMDECGGTTRASLLLLVDAACELIRWMSVDKPLQIAEVFKWAVCCRGRASLGEEEYLLAVQAVAEYIWRSTNHHVPSDLIETVEFQVKSPEERKQIDEQYKVKFAELYKKIVGTAPGKKWNEMD